MANVTSGNSVSSSAQLGTDVVTLPAMADDSVDKSNVKTGAVGTDEILDGEIVNADISASAAIADTKLAQITTADKVSGAALTSLSSIPSGAGQVPLANLPTLGKFGGTGADGALSITSGTTTLDLGAARYYVKNYTSISITGTGALAFTNPHANGTIIILKSQGNVVLTSSTTPLIDTRGMGASSGNDGTGMILRGIAGSGSATGGLQWSPIQTYDAGILQKSVYLAAGSGGGPAWTTGNATGGRGGGGLLIECGVDLNFTGTINVSGANGNTGTGESGGAGGGSCGLCVILYTTLTSASGTITATGGNGSAGVNVSAGTGDGGSGAGGPGGAGGAGAPSGAGGNAGGAGAGGGGGSTQGGNQAGGSGGSSFGGFVLKNTEFA